MPYGSPVRASRSWLWLWLVIVMLALGAAGGWWFVSGRSHSEPSAKSFALPNPTPADLQRVKQLAFWDFSMERKEGSGVTHAVARVLNESGETRFGIQVEFELRDAMGRVVGRARDYVERLEPGQQASVRALVIKREAVSARVVQITEQ